MRITFERRRSDFERDARVTPFTGSCCCCCCLHWIGALAGGVVGMRAGLIAGEKRLPAPLPIEGKSALLRGIVLGILASFAVFAGTVVVMGATNGDAGLSVAYLIALAFAPPVALIPVGATMVLSTHATRQRKFSAFKAEMAKLPPKDGSDKSMSLYRAKLTPAPKTHGSIEQISIFCRHCWTDLDESLHLTTCPECNQEIGHPIISGPDYGVSVAWRASLTSLGGATAGTLIGYVVMAIIAGLLTLGR